MRRAFVGVTAVLLGLVLFTRVAEAAPRVFAQGPCASGVQECLTFYFYSPNPVLRRFSFIAPRAGVAQVTFQGTLTCTSNSPVETYVDLAAQTVLSSTVQANFNGPGGLRHTAVLARVSQETTQTPTVAFNLASTRTISYGGGGRKYVYFRITKHRMDDGTSCRVYSAAFTVLYLS